ncbi:Alpha/beta hydrolase fold-3 domain protein [Chthoniobacter flavus Ellin428]|uniref:Alpha/beta hydrolase fold-3 domain protein n=1 Tax=Chthoniobacter flavus Ellin428 TaxID=497964 RepID=B4D9M5_9BACT|nr:alpha/beta hydrolase [Chthoniobacter flavus]EDY16806.1 Alpha/beta hydrolase fold-3 domain protein [Chthoniobacter flavus Ellin428]TCO93369.1 acetyl esterase [Chthoniobacter flavus]
MKLLSAIFPFALAMTFLAMPLHAQNAFTPAEPMDADSAAYLKALPSAAAGPQTPEMRREAYRRARLLTQPDLPQVYQIKEYQVPGPKGPITVRLYRGAGCSLEAPLPVLVFFHGGGWLVGNLDTHDWICRSIANKTDAAVVSVEYRLAPENPFPAAYEDAVAATRWVVANAATLHLDPEHVSVGGDSAGGNLAAATALALRNEGAVHLRSQILIYPSVDLSLSGDYYGRFTKDVILTDDAMRDYIEKYVPYAALRKDWRVSPLLAPSLEGLPPATFILAGYDPLCAEGEAYAARLQKEGVPATVKLYPGQMHGFLSNAKILPKAYQAINEIADALKKSAR